MTQEEQVGMASLISNGIINRLPELCVFVLNAKIGELLQKHIEPGAKPHFEKDTKFIHPTQLSKFC